MKDERDDKKPSDEETADMFRDLVRDGDKIERWYRDAGIASPPLLNLLNEHKN